MSKQKKTRKCSSSLRKKKYRSLNLQDPMKTQWESKFASRAASRFKLEIERCSGVRPKGSAVCFETENKSLESRASFCEEFIVWYRRRWMRFVLVETTLSRSNGCDSGIKRQQEEPCNVSLSLFPPVSTLRTPSPPGVVSGRLQRPG